MQEFFFTLLSIWLVWKLFDAFSSKRHSGPNWHQADQRNRNYSRHEEDARIANKSKKSAKPVDEGDYIDYEEIK